MAVVISDLNRFGRGRPAARKGGETEASPPPGPSAAAVAACTAGLAAVWLAAGSAGLLAHPLRHGLSWLLLGLAILLGRPAADRASRMLLVLLAAAAAIAMTASPLLPVNVLAATVVLALLALGRMEADRRVLQIAAAACAVLGLYRIGVTSLSAMWLMADAVGGKLGLLAAYLDGRPASVGATFAGLDCLVLMLALYVGWLAHGGRATLARAIAGLVALAVGELAWLWVLPQGLRLADAIDPAVLSKPWSWEGVLAAAVPWNLPVLACGIFLLIAAALLRTVRLPAAPLVASSPRQWAAGTVAACLLAALLPVVGTLSWGLQSLQGQKIVASTNLYGNWERPKHGDYGRLSIGMYGMLEQYVRSLGGQLVRSDDLSEQDLQDASALLMIYPHKPWGEGQLQRAWEFVQRGGTLLVFGEHTILEEDGGQRFNDVLAPTAMRIRFDTAEWAVGGWMHSTEAMAHPVTAGILDDRFGVTIGGSVDARWPARPLLVARWGWCDRGDLGNGESKLGNQRYDADERAGDVILAAEQPFGYGRIICVGDTGSITNGITIGAHAFTSRLLAYIAGRSVSDKWSDPQTPWRQLAAMIALVLLVGVLLSTAGTWRVLLPVLVAAGTLTLCTRYSSRANEVIPDGRPASGPNKLAYVDDAHLGAFSGEALRDNGLEGLYLTLMRSGYLTLTLPEFDPRRIERAGLIVSVAPSREFTEAERQTVRSFVYSGGTYILTVGGDAVGPSQSLLKDFGFEIQDTLFRAGLMYKETGTPRYVRHFKSPYMPIEGGYAYVRFWTAWPIAYQGPREESQVLALGPTDGDDLPTIMMRRFGQGKFVLMGDTAFAMNKNLERMDGQPIEGQHENAEFWRWLLGMLSGEESYTPGPKEAL